MAVVTDTVALALVAVDVVALVVVAFTTALSVTDRFEVNDAGVSDIILDD